MADWTNITDAMTDPDAPLTSELAKAWRDNPIAIAEGASGAPRVAYSALLKPVAGASNILVSNTVTVLSATSASRTLFSVSIINSGTVTVQTNATAMGIGANSILAITRVRDGNSTTVASYTSTGIRSDNVSVQAGDIVSVSLGYPTSGANTATASFRYGNDALVGVVTQMG